MKATRWQHSANLLLGVWLIVSPWALGFGSDGSPVSLNAYLSGAAVMVFAALALRTPSAWEEVANVLIGLWLAVSPWVLGFADQRLPVANVVATGALVAMVAAWALLSGGALDRWRRRNAHPTT